MKIALELGLIKKSNKYSNKYDVFIVDLCYLFGFGPDDISMVDEWLHARDVDVPMYFNKTDMPNDSLIVEASESIYIYSTKKINTKSYQLLEEKYIPKFKEIPPVYFAKVKKKIDVKDRGEFSKENVHYSYIYNYLKWNQDHFGYDDDNEFDEMASNFIKDNKSNIDKLYTFIDKQPVLLGTGSDGSAYDIGNGKILKLFMKQSILDEVEKINAENFGNKENAEVNAMYFDSGVIGEFASVPIYYYVQEKVKAGDRFFEVNNAASILSRDIISILENNSFDNPISKIDMIINNCKDGIDNINKKIEFHNSLRKTKKQDERINLSNGWEKKFVKEVIVKYLKYGENYDPNSGNIGITPYGTFKIFDPFYIPDYD